MSCPSKKTLPDKLCLIPFMGFNIHPTGKWQLCSSAREQNPLDLRSTTPSIWNGEKLYFVREKMQANQEVLPSCVGCYQLEKEGVASKRTRFNKKRLKLYGEDICYRSVYEEKKPVLELDISFSNVCNLDCVMCNSEYSSSWIQKDKKAFAKGLDFRGTKQNKFWTLEKQFIDSLIETCKKDIRLILIKGGEPFVDKNCLYFLSKLSEMGTREDLTIYIQTNGTLIDSEFISALRGLNIEISFSVDALGTHYSWIRGFDFEKMLENFKKLEALKNIKHSYFNYTVNAFNFHRVSEFIEFFITQKKENKKLRRLSFSIAHEKYLNFRVFHQDIRKRFLKQIEQMAHKLKVKEDFLDGYTSVLQELSLPVLDKDSFQNFRKWLSFCNSLRKQKLQDIDPIFENLLKEQFFKKRI